jgi:hypothetical protein
MPAACPSADRISRTQGCTSYSGSKIKNGKRKQANNKKNIEVEGIKDLVKEMGAFRNKNEFKLQVLARGDAIAISLFHSIHSPPLYLK